MTFALPPPGGSATVMKTFWIPIAILSWPAFAIAHDDADVATPRIVISTYDFAKISAKTLLQAEQLASAVFAAAGIEAQWAPGSLSEARNLGTDFSSVSTDQCAARLTQTGIRVQFLAHAPSGFAQNGLGFALPCAERGIQVTIYADRVEATTASTLASYYRVLGHAVAHEIGHVLLRSCRHDDSGLMKGVWSKLDWQHAAVALVAFTPGEATSIAEELRSNTVRRDSRASFQVANNAGRALPSNR
jgi:hypothetical protein